MQLCDSEYGIRDLPVNAKPSVSFSGFAPTSACVYASHTGRDSTSLCLMQRVGGGLKPQVRRIWSRFLSGEGDDQTAITPVRRIAGNQKHWLIVPNTAP